MRYNKNIEGFLIFATCIVLAMFYSCRSEVQSIDKNVLFILVDDLGWSDLECYGSNFHETPNIDRLAKEGVMFTNAYAAASVCSPTRASIMTGKNPARLRITDWIPGRQANKNPNAHQFEKLVSIPFQQFLPLSENTIAETLKKAGYQTFFAGKWHLGDDQKYWPENQGFDTNIGGWGMGYPKSFFSPFENPALKDVNEGEYLTDRLTNETINFIKNRENRRPFFAFLSFYAVHNPMQAKKEWLEKYSIKAKNMALVYEESFGIDSSWDKQSIQGWNLKLRKVQSNPKYAAMLETVDQNIGMLIQTLKDEGLYDNTLIIFTSDNGGLSTAEGSNTSNLPLKAGKGWLYEGGIRVPAIIYHPGSPISGKTSEVPITSMDFYPTILEYAGIDFEAGQRFDGKSIFPLLNGSGEESDFSDRPLFWHYPHYSNQGPQIGSVVLKNGFKLIEDMESGKVCLYDLSKDLGEVNDISALKPGKTNELMEILNHWRDSLAVDMPIAVVEKN